MTQEAYPITYGVLGLLAFAGPTSGYDLNQIFQTALASLWNVTHSQIYNELRRMEELGWVEMERFEQTNRPNKKIYRINENGREALRRWQATHPSSGLQMRDEVLLRFTFGSFADPRELAQTLREAIADHEARLAQYQENKNHIPSTPSSNTNEPDKYFVFMARFADIFEKGYLKWLREALAFVEGMIE